MASQNFDNIGPDIGLLVDGTKPLPEPMLTTQWGQFTWNAQNIHPWYEFENYKFKITGSFPSDQRVRSLI